MSTSQEYTISRKVSDTEEEIIQIPYDALANKPDLSVYQTKNDASLKTNDKTVVGAINEVVTGVAGTLESFGMSLAPQENGKLNKKVYVYPDGYFSQGTSYDASKDLYLSIGDGLTLETIDEANNIWNIKSGSAITSVDGLGGGAISGNVSTSGSLTVGGSLTVNGTTTTVDSTTLQVKDKLIEVAHGNTTKLTTPAGLVAPKYDGANSGALVFDSTGTAYVGDVKLDSTGNIDVAKSELQPLATRTGLVGGNLVQYDSAAQTLKDSGKKISDLATTSQVNAKYTKPSGGIPKTDLASDVQTSLGKADSALQAKDISGKANLSGGNTFSGNQVITGYLDIRGTAAEKHLKTSGIGGSDGNGNSSDLYLQYSSNYKTYFGKTGNSSLNADGSISINGKKAATTDQIPDISGKQDKLIAGSNITISGNTISAAVPTDVVKYTAQTLTDAQKSQARSNIGAGTSSFSGNYNDLSNKPTIPSAANNGTLTIQKNGTNVATFGANQSTNTTANITVPIKVSELTNDSGFITSDGSVKRVIDYNDTSKNIKIGYSGAGITGGDIKYIAGYTVSDGTTGNVARIKDISKDALKSWLGYATVATSGSYNDLTDKPTIPSGGITPFCMDDLSTGTFGSTTLGRSTTTKAVYFEDRDTSVFGFLYGKIYTLPKLYYLTNVSNESTSSGSEITFIFTQYAPNGNEKMIKSTRKIVLRDGKATYDEQTSISGTFYYKILE